MRQKPVLFHPEAGAYEAKCWAKKEQRGTIVGQAAMKLLVLGQYIKGKEKEIEEEKNVGCVCC
jgi:hypothetical protein